MRILLALLFSCGVLFGQSFEAATVRPADPKSTPDSRGGPGSSDLGHVTYTNLALNSLLVRALGVQFDQLTGPSSLQQHYTLVAKIPPGTTIDQFRAMLLNLLTERFHMAMHHETKEFQGYDLVIGKNGLKLKASSAADSDLAEHNPGQPISKIGPDGQAHIDRPGMSMSPFFGARAMSSHLSARAQTIADWARFLGQLMQTHIVDKTGLTGRYDFTLDYTLNTDLPPTGALDNTPPYVLDAIQMQLGLKLQPTKIPLDAVIVDHVDPVPAENSRLEIGPANQPLSY